MDDDSLAVLGAGAASGDAANCTDLATSLRTTSPTSKSRLSRDLGQSECEIVGGKWTVGMDVGVSSDVSSVVGKPTGASAIGTGVVTVGDNNSVRELTSVGDDGDGDAIDGLFTSLSLDITLPAVMPRCLSARRRACSRMRSFSLVIVNSLVVSSGNGTPNRCG